MKKITDLSAQVKRPERINVSVDGKYRFSLDISQIGELGIKIGREFSEDELVEIETESEFGKLYSRALEYTLIRPHSAREIKDYLWRKTQSKKYRSRQGEIKERQGASQSVAERVFSRLAERGYIDDEKFASYWVENRNQTKGASRRKLSAELRAKGVDSRLIESALSTSQRSDLEEIYKIIAKKQARYPDREKLMQYLARQGFSFDDIKQALAEDS